MEGFAFPPRPFPEAQAAISDMLDRVYAGLHDIDAAKLNEPRKKRGRVLTPRERAAIRRSEEDRRVLAERYGVTEDHITKLRREVNADPVRKRL